MIKQFLSLTSLYISSVLFSFIIGKYISSLLVPITLYSAIVFFIFYVILIHLQQNIFVEIFEIFTSSIYIFYLFKLVGISSYNFFTYIVLAVILLSIGILTEYDIKIFYN